MKVPKSLPGPNDFNLTRMIRLEPTHYRCHLCHGKGILAWTLEGNARHKPKHPNFHNSLTAINKQDVSLLGTATDFKCEAEQSKNSIISNVFLHDGYIYICFSISKLATSIMPKMSQKIYKTINTRHGGPLRPAETTSGFEGTAGDASKVVLQRLPNLVFVWWSKTNNAVRITVLFCSCGFEHAFLWCILLYLQWRNRRLKDVPQPTAQSVPWATRKQLCKMQLVSSHLMSSDVIWFPKVFSLQMFFFQPIGNLTVVKSDLFLTSSVFFFCFPHLHDHLPDTNHLQVSRVIDTSVVSAGVLGHIVRDPRQITWGFL